MAKRQALIWLMSALLLFCAQNYQIFGAQMSRKDKRDREIERKMRSVDESTRKTVEAMREAGFHEHIMHQKLAEEVGTIRSAKLIVKKLKEEAEHKENERKKSEASENSRKRKKNEEIQPIIRSTLTDEERRKERLKGQSKANQRFHQQTRNIHEKLKFSKAKAEMRKEFLEKTEL